VIGSVDAGISSVRHGVKCGAGVYFLWSGPKLIYAGQSVNVLKRICEHARDKEFDCSTFEPIATNDLTFVESYAIWFLRPKHNKHVPLLGSLGCCFKAKLKRKSVDFVCRFLNQSLSLHRVCDLFAEADDLLRFNASKTTSSHYRSVLLKQARRNEMVRKLYVLVAQEATDGAHP